MPYIGYFQLINTVDIFILYDNIKYTKKGWINRNRILVNGKDEYISLPLRKDSDFLDVNQRFLSVTAAKELKGILNKLTETYRGAPFYKDTIQLMETILSSKETNLFAFVKNSLELTLAYLNIITPIIVSSDIPINHTLKAERKVIEICRQLKAHKYINPIGGVSLYSTANFKNSNIELQFIQSNFVTYQQFGFDFVPWLSIIDVMMFNSRETLLKIINNDYQIIAGE